MSYRKWNLYLGWLVFLIATIVYFMTIEDTVSLWDCGEYITAAYKLEVGHPPGAPLFMLLGRLFSFFAKPEMVAVWINRLSALSSSLTILFMFWSLTLLLKKLALRDKNELTIADQIAIFGGATIGSLAYTFTDSFWFSAVEGEVYAMASLFTAIIFWAILKWDEEMAELQHGTLGAEYHPNRWLILIMFLLGLAVGVHLLGILVIPAIGFMIYFRYKKEVNWVGFVLTGVISVFVLGFIQEGVIPGSIWLASVFEVSFVNSLGLPFFSGTIFFFVLIVGLCVWLIRYARKKGNAILYNATMGLIVLLIGYGSFAVIVIRSNANPPLDENDPENLVTLRSYLKREQYGSAPLVTGPYWNSKPNDASLFNDRSAFYLRRFVVLKNDVEVKAFRHKKAAEAYVAKNGGEIDERYFESNAAVRHHSDPTYAQSTIFPRMYWNQEANRIQGYKDWSGYDASEDKGTEKGTDGMRLPSFGENINYFVKYQVNWMYWRYFMWNFAGRQNDIQGHGDEMRGNWISGIGAVDDARLGSQEHAPYYTSENPAHNKFFFLPLIIGVIGLFFHFYRAPKDAFVVLLGFIFTGVAIVVYLNQKPFEPRERDYAFAGSFYFFAFWIGVGIYALYEAFMRFEMKDIKKALVPAAIGLVYFFFIDMGSKVSMPSVIAWIIVAGSGIVLLLAMIGLRKVLKGKNAQGAVVASVLGLVVPVNLGIQGWNDHDRSLKTTANDLAYNYLETCGKNGILFTVGDNDTFPLWYLQEVEGKRTDVRVCNLSLMQTDWYTEQMKMKAYDSDPLPIKFQEDQILMYAGNTDQVAFVTLFQMFMLNAKDEVIRDVIRLRAKNNKTQVAAALENLNKQLSSIIPGVSTSEASLSAKVEEIKAKLLSNQGTDVAQLIYDKYRNSLELLGGVQSGIVKFGEGQAESLQKLMTDFDASWDYIDLKEAMEFTRNDDNMLVYEGRPMRFFPSSGFILKVNKENAVKSGIITEAEKNQCLDELRFNFEKGGILREQVMMLDILANNDWKRGVYFSSPAGSDVSMALYSKGYVKQNAMVFELSPLKNLDVRYSDKMYANLMSNYHFGQMNNPKVLTDYYARRNTSNYRMQFLSLADNYLSQIDQIKNAKQNMRFVAQLKQQGQFEQAKQIEELAKNADQKIADYKKRADELIKRSLFVMPADIVIDYGEPSSGRENYGNGSTGNYQSYSDGVLQEYVRVLFESGDKKSAEELGKTVADQLESIMNYFANSDGYFAGHNAKDLYAAAGDYFKMYIAAMDPETGNPSGVLARRSQVYIDKLYKVILPAIYQSLTERAQNNGESVRRGSRPGYYSSMLFSLQDYMQAMGAYYGYLKVSGNTPQPEPDNTAGDAALMQQLMQEQNVKDSFSDDQEH